MTDHSIRTSIVLVAAAAFCTAVVGQDPVPPTVVQEKLREWIQVKKTISAEESAWEQQKSTLTDLNEIRKKEIAGIDELIAASGTRLADAEKQRTDLLKEEETLRQKRAALEEKISTLEAALRDRIVAFPQPLLVKIDDEVERLLKADPEVPLQNRYRDVIAILNEAGTFENKITVETDLREIDGQQLEVEVIYLGLHQAYYVDRKATRAGTGKPGPEGWSWTADNKIAGEVRKAISVQGRKVTPDFVTLPLAGKESAK